MRLQTLVLIFNAVLLAGQMAWAVEWEGGRVVIARGEICRLNVHSIQQLLNLVPGVRAFGRHLSIRGSYDVEVFMDGLSLRDPLGGGIRLELVPFELVEKVVVYKGGGAAGWGEGGSGGVVMIYTRQQQALKASAELWAGAREYFDGRWCVGAARGQWTVGFTGQYMHSGGYRRNNDKHKLQGGLRLRWAPRWWKGPRLPTFVLNGCEIRRGLAGYPAYPTPRARAVDYSLAGSFSWANWGVSSVSSIKRIMANRSNPERALDSSLHCTTVAQRFLGAVGLWQWSVLGKYQWASGSELDRQGEWELGVRTARSWKAGPARFSAGLRGQLHSHFSPWVGPAGGVEVHLGRWQLTASLRLGRTLPTFRQRYLHSSTLLPNPSLGPQQSLSVGLGVRWKIPRGVKLGLGVFRTDVEDRITYVRSADAGQYRNTARTRTEGLELGVSWRLARAVGVRASYMYLDAKDLDRELWLPGKARHNLRVELTLGPVRGFSVRVSWSYRSEVFTRSDNLALSGARGLVEVRAEWAWGRVRIFARVDNLLDEQYLYGDGLPAPPLSWSMGLRWSL